MRFDISYSSGTRHQVELAGSVVVLGRDPGCDVVLNDTRCSRRHAVIEQGPEGLVVRDSGSANGVYLNGRRVESAVVRPGDTIRLGDVRLKLLAEIGETVVVALDELSLRAAEPHSPTSRPSPAGPAQVLELGPQSPKRPAAAAPPGLPRRSGEPPTKTESARIGRPLTVSVLSALWALVVPSALGLVAYGGWKLGAGLAGWSAGAAAALLVCAGATAMAVGLRRLAPWARHLQIAAAYLGLLVCPFTLASATVLFYLNRPDLRRAFGARAPRPSPDGTVTAEPTFALSILAMLVVGATATAVAAYLFWPHHT